MSLFVFYFSSCNHVDPNAVAGASDFCDEMSLYAITNNCDRANECLERYWKAYTKLDKLNMFCIALGGEFRSEKNHHVGRFIANIDTEKYPLFKDFKALFVATNDVYNRTTLKGLIERIGSISLLDGFAKGYISYDFDNNEVILLLKTNQKNDGIQKVDKQLAIDGLRIALNKDPLLLKLMIDANATYSFRYSDESEIFEVARLSPNEIEDMLNHPMSENERKDQLLENYVTKTNSTLPNQIAEGVIYQKVEIKGDYIIQQYHIDDNIYDIKEIEATLKAHKYDEIEDSIERNEYDIYTSHGKRAENRILQS